MWFKEFWEFVINTSLSSELKGRSCFYSLSHIKSYFHRTAEQMFPHGSMLWSYMCWCPFIKHPDCSALYYNAFAPSLPYLTSFSVSSCGVLLDDLYIFFSSLWWNKSLSRYILYKVYSAIINELDWNAAWSFVSLKPSQKFSMIVTGGPVSYMVQYSFYFDDKTY